MVVKMMLLVHLSEFHILDFLLYYADDLLLRIVKNLPHELNESTKQKWDLILVNQFFHEVKEAKKRGRKEKKNKEAQAVYAAAAEAAAVSSRNSLRKDTNDEIIAAAQEVNF